MPFPYTFPFTFDDKKDSRYAVANYDETDKSPASKEYEAVVDKSSVSNEYVVVNRSGLDDEYDTVKMRYGFPSDY